MFISWGENVSKQMKKYIAMLIFMNVNELREVTLI